MKFLCCILLFALTGCGSVWVERSESIRVGADGLIGVVCTSHSGSITLRGDPEIDHIAVTVRFEAAGFDDEDAADAIQALQLVERRRSRRLHLGCVWSEDPDLGWEGRASFDIVYPGRLDTTARTEDGGITILGAAGRCRATSRNGPIDVRGAAPWLRIESRNGPVRIGLRGPDPGDCEVRTRDGSVRITLDPGASARLRCTTRGGQVLSGFPLRAGVVTPGRLFGSVGPGRGRQITVWTRRGNVSVRPRRSLF